MRKRLLCILFLTLLMIIPVYAKAPYTIFLNGVNYTPTYSVEVIEDIPYLSLEDLTYLTYGNYDITQDTYTLYIHQHTIEFKPSSALIKINSKPVTLISKPLLQEDLIYLPINLLDSISYPYTLSTKDNSLTIESLAPYSRTTDTYNGHTLIATDYKNLTSALVPLISESEANSLLTYAVSHNQYISFATTTYKQALWQAVKTKLKDSKPMEVVIRKMDFLTTTPEISSLEALPLTATMKDDKLNVTIGPHKTSSNSLQATFNPSDSTVKIDADKSLDVMIMRTIYEYYRDHYDLKDDLHFSPITTIQMGRSDYTSYTVYSDHVLGKKVTYNVVIYKKINADRISYIVDFVLPTEKKTHS